MGNIVFYENKCFIFKHSHSNSVMTFSFSWIVPLPPRSPHILCVQRPHCSLSLATNLLFERVRNSPLLFCIFHVHFSIFIFAAKCISLNSIRRNKGKKNWVVHRKYNKLKVHNHTLKPSGRRDSGSWHFFINKRIWRQCTQLNSFVHACMKYAIRYRIWYTAQGTGHTRCSSNTEKRKKKTETNEMERKRTTENGERTKKPTATTCCGIIV